MFSSAVRVTVFGGPEGCGLGILSPSRLRCAQLQSAVTPDDADYCRTYYKAASARGGGLRRIVDSEECFFALLQPTQVA
jgi:hypothetical protein